MDGELKSEIVRCLKAGPSGWTNEQQSLSAPAKWIVSAARGKRDVRDISVDFRRKFLRTLACEEDGDGDMLRESIRVLRAQLSGLRDWKENQDKDILLAYPASELIEVMAGEAMPDWKDRWAAAGGLVVNGRCVALKSAEVWRRFSEFGQRYEPYEWSAGLGREDVSSTEAKDFGLLPATPVAAGNGMGCLIAILLGVLFISAAAFAVASHK